MTTLTLHVLPALPDEVQAELDKPLHDTISDASARTIAGWWGSPRMTEEFGQRTISVLADLASGRPVDGEQAADAVSQILGQLGRQRGGREAKRALQHLLGWLESAIYAAQAAPGRLRLSENEDGSISLTDLEQGVEITGLSASDLTRLVTQLRQMPSDGVQDGSAKSR